jgi:hypothetical protein
MKSLDFKKSWVRKISLPLLLAIGLIGMTIFPVRLFGRLPSRLTHSAPQPQRRPQTTQRAPQATTRSRVKPKTATTSTFSPLADAYVLSTSTTTNFGSAADLRSKRSNLESYLKFDLNSVATETVVSAKLRLTGQLNDTSGVNVTTQVFSVSSVSWTETGITWANKPSSGSTALAGTIITDNLPNVYEWDVTAYVKTETNAERNTISLAVKNPATSTPYAVFNSREATSNPPELVVVTTEPPTVNITSPASGTNFLAPATITIDADAADADGLTKVEFLRGTNLLATDTAFPYSFDWTNVALGNYTLTVRATDTLGAVTTSAPINVSVVATFPPSVAITSPVSGTTFPSPATITITAEATDTDGISKVDFYQGNILIGTVSQPPYSFTWTGMPSCSFFLTAKATDSLGAVATSAPILVKVTGGEIGESTPPNFKVAFFGDEGIDPTSVAALNLVKNEGAQALVVAGDLDYADTPAAWEAQLNNTVGPDFPVFALSGNHDEDAWHGPTGYQKFIQDRFIRLGIPWCGSLGVQSSFHYKGIFFIFTTPGLDPIVDLGNNDTYIREQLAGDHSIWSISAWHKNMHLMQAGDKSDETGWEVYEESRAGGAIIATAHEHSYFRTHLLSSMMSQTVASTANTLTLTKGTSFVFVSGLGGESRRDQAVTGPWVAKIYATPCLPGDPVCQPNAVEGALFGVFNVDGQQNKANFYFKDVNGQIIDSFTVISEVDMPAVSSISPAQVVAGGTAFTLTVNGSNFINESQVRLNGSQRPTTFVSNTQLTAQITADDILSGNTLALTVFNAVTGGGTSNSVNLTVNNPIPTVSNLTPSNVQAGGPNFTLTVDGSGFVNTSIVRFNGDDRPTTFVNSAQLTAEITATDIELAGTSPITVFNPPPAGGVSNSFDFTTGPAGYEADVSPRPGGSNNGTVSIADWAQVGRFAAGLDTVSCAAGEFQRVDCAPKESLGNGAITIGDWVQAGRYATGLDPVVVAGGSTCDSVEAIKNLGRSAAFEAIPSVRLVEIQSPTIRFRETGIVTITLQAQGDESAMGLSLRFNPAHFSFVSARTGNDARDATLVVNSNHAAAGNVGIAVALPPGQSFAAGARQVVVVTLRALTRGGHLMTELSDRPLKSELVDIYGRELLSRFVFYPPPEKAKLRQKF